jgi:hypothetical protein
MSIISDCVYPTGLMREITYTQPGLYIIFREAQLSYKTCKVQMMQVWIVDFGFWIAADSPTLNI